MIVMDMYVVINIQGITHTRIHRAGGGFHMMFNTFFVLWLFLRFSDF